MNDWRDRAACLGLDFELAFSAGHCAPMIATCAACPVRGDCLDEALHDLQAEQVGIRGGLYAGERVAILRGRRPWPIYIYGRGDR